jgi:hypothetical protein
MKNFVQNISGLSKNNSLCPELDLKTRVIGFFISCLIGIIMMIGSIYQLYTLSFGGQRFFAIWYTLGNIVALSSTFFLMGPKKQCENMMNKIRFKASLLLISSIICCFIFGVFGFNKILVILSVFVQFFALIWYVLSYIPMGRTIVGKFIKNFFFGDNEDYYSIV